MTCLECQQLLSPYQKGELDADEAGAVGSHVSDCHTCADRVAALRQLDDLLRAIPTPAPPMSALMAVRERVHSGPEGGEIMDADQVAAFLKLTREQILDSLDELPCFEVAGQIRFRRTALMRWIEEREADRRREALRAELTDERSFGARGVLTLDP